MDAEELWEFVKNDKPTPDEIFQSLVERMKKLSPKPISDYEATEGVRNLLGFCTTLVNGRKK